jgi:predicted dinucleotide-binding enzyme
MNAHHRRFLVVAGAIVAAAALPSYALAADKVKIGIIASGNVGSAIGAVWVEAGHEVMFSSRHIEHDEALAARLGAGARARAGMPIASDDAQALEMASGLIREIGYEPVIVGGLAMGKYLLPGTVLSGERSAEEIRRIADGLD